MDKFKNILVSVSDKSGLIELIEPLYNEGARVVSTGGTAKHLIEAGIKVVSVEELTGFKEVMGGRVKSIHPNIHMSLLARAGVEEDSQSLKEAGLELFDLVVCNLYPFEEAYHEGLSEKELIEKIDIGGPTMLRAAAKNYSSVTVLSDPKDYDLVFSGEAKKSSRKLAAKVFSHISAYDSLVAKSLGSTYSGENFGINLGFKKKLRYGENPQQDAYWMINKEIKNDFFKGCKQLHGKALSYNNILDIEAAIETLFEFKEPACISVKHNNPCGVSVGDSIQEVVEKSISADPVSVFGGVIAINRPVGEKEAKVLSGLFLEVVLAPQFTNEALEVLSVKKNIRLIKFSKDYDLQPVRYRSVMGSSLIQERDTIANSWEESWIVHGDSPSDQDKKQLLLAWKVCAHLKSNAIAIVGEDQSLGLGMGQVNRVDAVEQAITRWKKHSPNISRGYMASDAFFPFADSIEKAHKAGVRWVIQPGGSIKDSEVISRAKALGVNLVITGKRHFLH